MDGSRKRSNQITLQQPVIAIVGPTASGKTDVAQLVAKGCDAEVTSADSMQIYKGMDIGTGKLKPEQRLVPHHGFDIVDPGEPYSAALFQAFARQTFQEVEQRGHRNVLAGGTGFYVRAAIDAYEFPQGAQVDNPIRAQYNLLAQEHGAQHVWELLNQQDPQSAAVIPANDVKRVVRAFELLAEGTSYARQKEALASIPQAVPALMFGLAVDPDVLRARIDARVDGMVEAGLVKEVKCLLQAGFREGITAPQAIGYKEIVQALDGCITLDEAVAQIKVATHRYAKRQRTWFRKDTRIIWLDATNQPADALAGMILGHL